MITFARVSAALLVVATAAGLALFAAGVMPRQTGEVPAQSQSASAPATSNSTAPSSSSAPSPSSTESDGQPIDYEVAEAYLRNLTGSSCSSGLDATIGVPDSLLAAAEAPPQDHNDWLRSGVWLGSSESLRAELGGELIADRGTYFWVLSTVEDGAPFAQLARSVATDTGRRLWFVAGSVHSLDPSDCE